MPVASSIPTLDVASPQQAPYKLRPKQNQQQQQQPVLTQMQREHSPRPPEAAADAVTGPARKHRVR